MSGPRRAALLAGGVAILAGCAARPVPPQGVSPADLSAYRLALADVGCTVADAATAARVEGATGLSDGQLEAVTDYLVESGELTPLVPLGVRLTTGRCA